MYCVRGHDTNTILVFYSINILLAPSSKSQIRPRIRMEAKGTDEDSNVDQSYHGWFLLESVVVRSSSVDLRL